ncbi:MAG TPA: hypothetical protein ENG42_01695 [Candidatus Aenigmarchaeota archaeon]|nr:MAG: hypothetical protein DRP03_01580 [Candidatus Aenigmarchaeota archaeon]HDD46163.1 hypothetical protein [Candidatus Aenigmarchaeota archaeon]
MGKRYSMEVVDYFLDQYPGFMDMPYKEQVRVVADYLGLQLDQEGIMTAGEFIKDVTEAKLKKSALRAAIPAIMIRNNTTSYGSRVLELYAFYL